MLYLLIGLAFIFPQKVIGESNWGSYTIVQALLTSIYMLSDGLALQAMVNFGMEGTHRSQAMTFSAIAHTVFILGCTAIIYFGRDMMAGLWNKPDLVPVLALFPLVSLGFLLRNYFLKVSQLHIDTRATFLIDLAWIGSTVILIVYGWRNGTLVTAEDMMVISAISSGASSLTGLLLLGGRVRFTRSIDRTEARQMLRFGMTQFGSAATLVMQTTGDTLILGRFVTTAAIGNYDAAKKIFRGFEALRDAGALFVYPAVARLKVQGRDAEMVRLVEKMIGFMLIVILPIVLLVWIGPTDQLFALVYKGKYQDAPVIFRLLSLAALAIPFSMNMNVLNGLGEVRTSFRVTLTAAMVFFLAALFLVPAYGAFGAAMTIVVSYASLGLLSTRAVAQRVPFSLRSAFGSWRDAADFAARMWRQGMRRGGRIRNHPRFRRKTSRLPEKDVSRKK
jgi:O-antigen/teichoic acid export membrane protein